MRLFGFFCLFVFFFSVAPPAAVAATTTSAIPRPSTLLPAGVIDKRPYAVERLSVYTRRNITMVKSRLVQQLGILTAPSLLSAGATSQQNYTATVNRYKGPAGYVWFLSIFHGRWFRLFGFSDPRQYVPTEMQQYTIGDPLVLLNVAKYTIEAFLSSPVRLLVYDTADGGTMVVWDRPCTLQVLPGAPVAAYLACRASDDQVSLYTLRR
ncbi:hypothetical protein ABW21_db0206656 [Orbilia brochopaga]|nr:hypothetical protein ABW21_db0206656 [Drechslerella brochopaga]